MNKQTVLTRLDAVITALQDLRTALTTDKEDVVRFPVTYNTPISALKAGGLRNASAFRTGCARHMITTVGQLARAGRASVAKWPGIGPRIIQAIAQELHDDYAIAW